MGREATCMCEWNGEMARVKALIEPPELILRGEIRRRLLFSELQQLRAEGRRAAIQIWARRGNAEA